MRHTLSHTSLLTPPLPSSLLIMRSSHPPAPRHSSAASAASSSSSALQSCARHHGLSLLPLSAVVLTSPPLRCNQCDMQFNTNDTYTMAKCLHVLCEKQTHTQQTEEEQSREKRRERQQHSGRGAENRSPPLSSSSLLSPLSSVCIVLGVGCAEEVSHRHKCPVCLGPVLDGEMTHTEIEDDDANRAPEIKSKQHKHTHTHTEERERETERESTGTHSERGI